MLQKAQGADSEKDLKCVDQVIGDLCEGEIQITRGKKVNEWPGSRLTLAISRDGIMKDQILILLQF